MDDNLTMGWTERHDDLDAMLAEAGHTPTSGYEVTDDTIGWVIEHERRFVLSERDRHAWLIAEVGIEGDGVYPEDDLAEESEIDVPADHVLWWDDPAERAMLALDLGGKVTPGRLKDAIPAFARLANDVERRLCLREDLGLQPSPADGDLFQRGYFRPPDDFM